MRNYLLALSLSLAATPAFSCTVEDIQKKTATLMTEAQAAVARNQAAAQAWGQTMQAEMGKITQMTKPEEGCALMDRLIGEAQAIK